MSNDTPATPGRSLDLDELRTILSDEIRKIQAGQQTAANANAVSNAAGKILGTVKIQMEYARLTGQRPSIPMLESALPLDAARPVPA